MNIKFVFLNRVHKEEVYIEQLMDDMVKKQENNFINYSHKHALYVKTKEESILIVCLYVDDLIFIGNNPNIFEEFKKAMARKFEMTDISL